jgi:hypothetical protein
MLAEEPLPEEPPLSEPLSLVDPLPLVDPPWEVLAPLLPCAVVLELVLDDSPPPLELLQAAVRASVATTMVRYMEVLPGERGVKGAGVLPCSSPGDRATLPSGSRKVEPARRRCAQRPKRAMSAP